MTYLSLDHTTRDREETIPKLSFDFTMHGYTVQANRHIRELFVSTQTLRSTRTKSETILLTSLMV